MIKIKDYKDLSPSTQKRLSTLLETLYKSGISVIQANNMTDSELRQAINSNAKDMNPNRRLIKQLIKTPDRKKGSIDIVKDKLKKEGWKDKALDNRVKELNKTVGSTFLYVSNELQVRKGMSEKDSWTRARFLLKLPESKYNEIDLIEKDIMENIEPSP